MWVAIVGSRTFGECGCMDPHPTIIWKHEKGCRWPQHYRLVAKVVTRLKTVHGDKLDGVVSGAARGVDTLARVACNELGVRIVEFPVEDGPGSFAERAYRRNNQIVHHANMVIAIFAPGPRTHGTQNTVERAVALRLPVHVYHEGTWRTIAP